MSKTLTIYLAADIKKLTGGLNQAQAQMNGFQRGMSNLSNSMSAMLGPALIGAGVAAGALAVSLGVDGVQAAMADDAAASKLAKTMENLGLSQDTAAAEAQIDVMQRQLGIADDLLRPSFEKLARAYGDTSEALDMLALATDIAAGTGRSLDQVTQALTRAAGGSATALGRIAPELDKNILKSGDMNAITQALSDTFTGQAQKAAQTYQGQLNRLAIGFDELKESFGKGFLSGLDGADGKADELMRTLSELEPKMEKLGEATFDVGVALLNTGNTMIDVKNSIERGADFAVARFSISLIRNADALGIVSDEAGAAAEAEYQLYLATNNLIGEMDPAARAAYTLSLRYQGLADAANAAAGATSAAAAENPAATKSHLVYGQVLWAGERIMNDYSEAQETSTFATASASTAVDALTASYDRQNERLAETTEKIAKQTDALLKANQDVADYSAGIANAILGNIDLGQASETGAELGTSTLEAFNNQIAQAQWFGNVLQEVKASGADQKLIDELASLGPAVGGKLAQEMIDKGLIQTFSDKIVDITAKANEIGMAMVPEFLLAGQAQAAADVDGMVEGFAKESDRLKKLGKAIGKPIGSNIKAEILKAAAEALEIAEANQKASEARRAATRATEQAAASPQQLVQLLAQVVNTSNARTGYSMGVPIPSPVLG